MIGRAPASTRGGLVSDSGVAPALDLLEIGYALGDGGGPARDCPRSRSRGRGSITPASGFNRGRRNRG